MPGKATSFMGALPWLISGLLVLVGCDTNDPSHSSQLVVEGYFDAGRPLPPVRVGQTLPVGVPLSDADFTVSDAQVHLSIGGTQVRYAASPTEIGTYVPESHPDVPTAPPGAAFTLTVSRDLESVVAIGVIPPLIRLRDVQLLIPDRAVEAIFIDTLDIGLDSLDLGLDARQGYIYPIQVSMEWDQEEDERFEADALWIETRLDPVTPFPSGIIDFFLLPNQIVRESSTRLLPDGRRSWTGVYAVPVEAENDPVPVHDLKLTILRGDDRFARFTTSRGDPGRREPEPSAGNAIGFIGGISVDSLRIQVGQ